MSFKCSCGFIHSGIVKSCKFCNTPTSPITYDYLMYVIDSKGLNLMSNTEELYVRFYNSARIAVSELTDEQLSERIDELELIALEAKATLRAAGDTRREKRAKLTISQKDHLVTREQTSADRDAINAPKLRADRMSKLDKMIENWRKIPGLSEETIQQMIKDIEKRATDRQVKAAASETASVLKSSPKAETRRSETPKNVDTTNSEPFDPSKLFS